MRWRYYVDPAEYRAELRADGRRWPDTAPRCTVSTLKPLPRR